MGTEYIVTWDGIKLADVVNAPMASWQQMSFAPTASATTSVLKFEFVNSPDAFVLDDVSVTASPEPVSLILTGTSLIGLVGLSRLMRRNRR